MSAGATVTAGGSVQSLRISELTVNELTGPRSVVIPAGATIPFPLIKKSGPQTLYTNVAPTTLTFTPPATAGIYRLSAYFDALTAGTMTFAVKITYKDPGGNAVSDVPGFYLQNTTAVLAGGNAANTTGRYIMIPHTIAIDNSATAITIQDNSGTYTAGTYYWTPVLEQLA